MRLRLRWWRGYDDNTTEEFGRCESDCSGAGASARGTVPSEPERSGHRCGRHQPLRGSSRRPCGAAGARVRRFHGGPVPSGRLADRVRCGDRGHGVHGRVLDTSVRGARRTGLPGDAGGPAPHQERVRSQDRRAGLPVATATAHLRTAVGRLPSRGGHPPPAQLPAAAGHAGGVRVPSYPNICRRP